jgi:hypothetical protein
MKYHGFDSPLDWSQHLIQKADLHEYEPSEPGKRVETLLKNSTCRRTPIPTQSFLNGLRMPLTRGQKRNRYGM